MNCIIVSRFSSIHSEKILKSFKLSELLSILLVVLGLMLLSEPIFGAWSGQAKYFLTEITILAFIILVIKIRGLSTVKLLRWRPVKAKYWITLAVLTITSTILLSEIDKVINVLISTPLEYLADIEKSYKFNSISDIIWMVFGIGITASWVEESIFRGLIQNTLEAKYSYLVAIIVTSILFALIHMQAYWFIQLTLLSLVTGICVWRMDSIIPGVLIHSANNVWSLIQINDLTPNIEKLLGWNNNYYILIIIAIIYGFINSLKKIYGIRRSDIV